MWHIFWHSIWHIFWHFIWQCILHIFWHLIWHSFRHSNLLADNRSGILSDLQSSILSDFLSDGLSDGLSDILCDIFSGSLWEVYLTYILTFYLAFYLTEILTVHLAVTPSGAHWAREIPGWGPAAPIAIRSCQRGGGGGGGGGGRGGSGKLSIKSHKSHLQGGENQPVLASSTVIPSKSWSTLEPSMFKLAMAPLEISLGRPWESQLERLDHSKHPGSGFIPRNLTWNSEKLDTMQAIKMSGMMSICNFPFLSWKAANMPTES